MCIWYIKQKENFKLFRTLHEGALICALVEMGKIKYVSQPDSGITADKLAAEGYDSVYAVTKPGFLTRDEFVVYK